MNDLFSKLPDLPDWVYWIVVAVIAAAWVLERIVFRARESKGQAIENEMSLLSLAEKKEAKWKQEIKEKDEEIQQLKRAQDDRFKTEEDAGALNNAGVAAQSLSLPITSVNYYRMAKERGNTLSSSNLASKLIDIGFVDEAETVLSEAEQKSKVHQNVYSVRVEIAEQRDTEKEELIAIEKRVEKMRKWRLLYGEAMLQRLADPTIVSGHYTGEPGELDIEVGEAGEIRGELHLPNETQPARVWGHLEGSGINFSWQWDPPEKEEKDQSLAQTLLAPHSPTPPFGIGSLLSSYTYTPPPRSEQGFLIIENGKLYGYSGSEEESFDPSPDLDQTEWKLEKDEVALNQSSSASEDKT